MTIQVYIEGVGLWSPRLPGWSAAQPLLRGEQAVGAATTARPAPSLLAPNERRRAPDSVLLAFEVAQQACAMAGRDPGALPALFASAYGDLAISDYLCATLARAPEELSPTKFHNSVHNAPAGYWAIATGCMASTSAISAGEHSFAAGLLEAALLAHSENIAVVYAAYDIAAGGPMADVIACRSLFGVGLLLAPRRERAGAMLSLALHGATAPRLAPEPSLLQSCHDDNPAAASLPLLAALARNAPATLALAAGPQATLQLEVSAWST
jgi:hypothetical protein